VLCHGSIVLEETQSKLPPLIVPAIARDPPGETDYLYCPPPEDKDWNEHPERRIIEEEMSYLHMHSDKSLGRKNDPSFVAHIPISPWLHELRLMFTVMFNMNGNNTYNALDMNLIKEWNLMVSVSTPWSFKKGEHNAHLLLPYIGISKSSNVRHGGFGSTNKQINYSTLIQE
jgi:hypothetical protein